MINFNLQWMRLQASFSARPRLWAFLFALLIALASVPRAQKLRSADFEVFYVAGRHALTQAADIYRISPQRYLYPPSAAILFAPFAVTKDYPLHQWIWHGFLAVIVWLLAGRSVFTLAAMALLSRYLAITFGFGQINLVMIGMLAATASLLTRRPRWAGALWATAVSLKIYPLVFFPAFLKGPFRTGILGAAITGVILAVSPLLFFGPAQGMQLYSEFLQALESRGAPIHSHNQSFSALFQRLFTDQSFHLHAVADVNWSILSLPPRTVQFMSFSLGILLAGLSWLKAWKRNDTQSFLSAAAFSVLFLSHIVWKDYLIFVFFPLVEVLQRNSKRNSLLLAGAYFSLLTFSSHDLAGAPISTRLDAACIHLWGAVFIWVAWMRLQASEQGLDHQVKAKV